MRVAVCLTGYLRTFTVFAVHSAQRRAARRSGNDFRGSGTALSLDPPLKNVDLVGGVANRRRGYGKGHERSCLHDRVSKNVLGPERVPEHRVGP